MIIAQTLKALDFLLKKSALTTVVFYTRKKTSIRRIDELFPLKPSLAEEIQKMTSILLKMMKVVISSVNFCQLLSLLQLLFSSQFEIHKSRVKWDNSRNSTQKTNNKIDIKIYNFSEVKSSPVIWVVPLNAGMQIWNVQFQWMNLEILSVQNRFRPCQFVFGTIQTSNFTVRPTLTKFQVPKFSIAIIIQLSNHKYC